MSPMPPVPFPRPARPLLWMFFLSGFSALVYQTAWIRLAFASFGVITPVLSIVVSVFMMGLGLGAWAGGRWAGPFTRRTGLSPLQVYAGLEGMTALGGVLVPRLFRLSGGWLWNMGGLNSAGYLEASGILIALTLLPWTAAMGATTFLALQYLRERHPDSREGFGALYLANSAGALAGVILTAFVLLETLGFRSTLDLAVAFNLLAGGAALAWNRKNPRPAPGRTGVVPARPVHPPLGSGGRGWAATVLALTGFVSLGYEVAWYRCFSPYLGTQVYAFAAVLAVYLAATTVGAALYRAHLRSGAAWSPDRLLPVLALAGLLPMAACDLRMGPVPWKLLLSLAPLCLLLGYQTPSLVDQASGGDPRVAGRLYALNVMGCILGPLAASYLLLPTWGETKTLAVLTLPLLALAWTTRGSAFGIARRWGLPLAATALLGIAVTGLWTYDDNPMLLAVPHRVLRDTTATVVAYGEGRKKQLLVNGIPLTTLAEVTKDMAHLPAACLPREPRNALVICFGMGTTFRSLMSWGIPVEAVELVPGVRDQFDFYYPDGPGRVAASGSHITVDDGRRFLARSGNAEYDLITLDPPPPLEAACSSLLYTPEFYALVKRHLSKDGILAQWMPPGEPVIMGTFLRAFRESFPYVAFTEPRPVEGFHLLGSKGPFRLPTVDEALARMGPAARQDLMEWGNPAGLRARVGLLLANPLPWESLAPPDWIPRISDDRPVNEYFLLRRKVLPSLARWMPRRP